MERLQDKITNYLNENLLQHEFYFQFQKYKYCIRKKPPEVKMTLKTNPKHCKFQFVGYVTTGEKHADTEKSVLQSSISKWRILKQSWNFFRLATVSIIL